MAVNIVSNATQHQNWSADRQQLQKQCGGWQKCLQAEMTIGWPDTCPPTCKKWGIACCLDEAFGNELVYIEQHETNHSAASETSKNPLPTY